MKAKLTNKIYMKCDPDYFNKVIKPGLTYTIPAAFGGAFPTVMSLYTVIKRGRDEMIVALPIGATHLIPDGYEIIEARSNTPIDLHIVAEVELRGSQLEIVEAIDDNGIVVAPPSWGKTFTGLHLAEKLKRKTLIIVHTLLLAQQWVEEVEKLYEWTPDLVTAKCKRMETPIVIGTVQSIIKMLDDPKLMSEFNLFGLVIVDEVHHAPSNTFTSVVNRMRARYKVGLSATPKRKDGKHVVLGDIFGDKWHLGAVENRMVPVVKQVILDNVVPTLGDWHVRMESMYHDPGYGEAIIDIVDALVAGGHRVLIVSSRTGFCDALETLIEGCVAIHSKVKAVERDAKFAAMRSGEAKVIAGGINIFKEGISENYLSALVLAISTDNIYLLEQVAGRILRLQEGKNTPVIVDLVPKGKTFKRHANIRKGWYHTQGWEVTTHD